MQRVHAALALALAAHVVGSTAASVVSAGAGGPGRPDRPPSRQSSLLPVARPAGPPDHLRRTLRRGDEPGLRLPQVSGHARRRRHELHASVQRRVRRAPGRVQDRAQHAGAAARTVSRALAAQQPARLSGRWQQVRSVALGRRLLLQAEGLRRPRRHPQRRRRAHPVLPDVRRGAVEPESDERRQQRQRCGEGRPQRGLHPRQGPGTAGGSGGADAQAGHGAQRLRESVLRDLPTSRTSAA